jgi:hypothetical protein
LYRAVAGIFGTAIGSYLITFFGIFGIIGDGDSAKAALVVYVFALIFGIIIMMWGYKKFRYGGEVEEGTGIVAPPKKGFFGGKNTNTVKSMASGINVVDVASIASSFLRR